MMKKTLAVLAMACTILFARLPAVAAQNPFPQPPTLYSQAAILMDAQTGQVLYGKNMNQRMYPASLTKVVTCLLAMERGNMSDRVVMTDEGVFSVPRSTTHIALTPGEVLTLEQLTFAMMVESANDAANGIAIHIGGSLEGFAEMMNQKAVEIGAVGSHFTNASGLPDSNHYTTAYDLGLFTKAAMDYPVFRIFAGTQRYQIPPTNKQPDTRYLNNRQYMFCLNDVYPGAFAGKTGWTEEAGKTLITIAERDGVTLIAVVLKAKGTVDAEFKDSTKLLDYGFDNFVRAVVSKDVVPEQETLLNLEDGTQVPAVFRMQEDMPVLLPKGLDKEQLIVQVKSADDGQNAKVELLAPFIAQASMESVAGSFAMTAVPIEQPQLPAVEDTRETVLRSIQDTVFSFGLRVLVWCAGGIALLFILRWLIICHYKRRRRRRRGQVRLAANRLSRNRDRLPAVDVRVYKEERNRIHIIDTHDWRRH